MPHKSFLMLTILIAAIASSFSFAQTEAGLLSTLLKLEDYLQRTDDNIRRYENSIRKCDNIISTSNTIIKSAREQGNTKAEKVANDALSKANETKQKNINLIAVTGVKKKQTRGIISSLKNKAGSDLSRTTANLVSCSGDVTILKKNGSRVKVDENNSILEDGDEIRTGEKSRLEMIFADGRGNMVLGESSSLKFTKDDTTSIAELINGKVKMSIEKAEKFYDSLLARYEVYKKNVYPPDEAYERFIKRMRAKLLKKFEVRIRCSGGGGAVRGTEFISSATDGTWELIVTEGSVEMTSAKGKTIIVQGGQRGVIYKDNSILGPEKIDTSKIEQWWKDEE